MKHNLCFCGEPLHAKGFCKKHYMNEYRKNLEIKQRNKEYQKKYYLRPKTQKRLKKYYADPEVKARRKEYYSRPEVKERYKKLGKLWRSKPKNRLKIIAYRRNYQKPFSGFVSEFMKHFPNRIKEEELESVAVLYSEIACELSKKEQCQLLEKILIKLGEKNSEDTV
jgi:hypothetical protein